jgi:hypothetical protein
MSSDNRRSYRYRVQEEFTHAKILHGRKEWPAELVNESAGGFLVSLAADANLKPGESVTLSIHSGAYLVEIVHVRREEKKAYVGVRRFDDDIQPRSATSIRRGWFGPSGAAPYQSSQTFLLFGAYVGLAALAAVLIVGGHAGRGVASLLGESSRIAHGPSLPALPSDFAGPIDWQTVHTLRGINSLASQTVRDAIGLTKTQQRSLDTIFSETSRRMQKLAEECKEAPSSQWSEQSTQVIDEAVQRVLCTLTDRQIERWREELVDRLREAPQDE